MLALWNDWDGHEDHQQVINRLLKSTKRFDCIVAFARRSGFDVIYDVLLQRLKAGMAARFVVGLDFCHTEPFVLKRLFELKSRYQVQVLVSDSVEPCTFHPKLYRFDHGNHISLLIGSANLTAGGLSGNHEMSAVLSLKHEDQIAAYLKELIDRKEVIELTRPVLDVYRARYDAYHLVRRRFEKRIKRVLSSGDAGLDALIIIHNEMARNGEFGKRVKLRRDNRRRARELLQQLEALPRISKSDFLNYYDNLVGFWHSGGLTRNKTRIAASPEIFRQIVNAAARYQREPVAICFERLRALANRASGIGPNVLTEILQTYDNKRFAVMNQNSVSGVKMAGFFEFPDKPNKGTVDGKLYEQFCRRTDSIRSRLDLKNLSELDAVLDYAYFLQD